MGPAGTHIEANGLNIYYEAYGEGEPLLLLVGDRDGACTEEAPELFRLLPDAELAVAPGSDHGFVEKKAGLFDALALDFLLRHCGHPLGGQHDDA